MRLSRPQRGKFFSEGSRRLWLWLREHGATQTDLARKLGTESGHVSHWLYGSRRPGLEWALAVQRELGVDAGDWLKPPSRPFAIPD